MDQILNHMAMNGLKPTTLALDGHLKRFKAGPDDKGTAGWYLGYQNFSSEDGAPFHVVIYGNFKTGEKFQYQSDMKYSPSDKKNLQDNIKKAQLKIEQERKEMHEQSAKECQEIWGKLSETGSFYYLEKKRIEGGLYGARVGGGLGQRKIYIPLCDADGKLWSLQSITEDTSIKKFYPGGRISGLFHLIGDIKQSDEIIVTEGFATGVSIFMATQKPVAIAFNAGNLADVCHELKQKNPDKLFIVAGDDDVWTTKQDGTPWNPGREAAEAAAKKVLGVAVFPKFRSLEKGRTTDFNDLHVFEGIETVRKQILAEKPKRHYIIPLGYDSGDYFFLSNVNPQIQKLSASALGTSAGLCRLQPLVYWETLYPSQKNEGVAWTRAADHLMNECHNKGIFKPSNVRGRGVWTDKKRVVYHMGDRIWHDGLELDLHRNKLESKYIYELAEALPAVHSQPLSVEECKTFVNACQAIRWRKADSFMLYAGWIALAPIGGALKWRPHVWLSGASGTGKSYVMQEVTFPLLRDYARYFRGNTSEAGIRQEAGNSTMPIIFDEFETNDKKSGDRVRSILELARQASSDSDGIVAKGTVSGDAQQFKPQFAMMVASVRTNLVHEEDENRFAVLELARGDKGDTRQFEKLKELVSKIDEEFGRRLHARALTLADQIRESAEVLQKIIAAKFSMRIGQQYGALLGAYWSLVSDSAINQSQAEDLIKNIDLGSAAVTLERNDEQECLDHLVDKILKTESNGNTFEASIREIIGRAVNADPQANPFAGYGGPSYTDTLERIGFTITSDNNVAIHATHRSVKDFFYNSRWDGSFAKQLSRIPGVKTGVSTRFGTTKNVAKCIHVPLNLILK